MRLVEINGKKVNMEKVVNGNLKVIDIINNVEANVERIIIAARASKQKPFNGSHKSLKTWLIANQGYDKYVAEVFYYFLNKCKI